MIEIQEIEQGRLDIQANLDSAKTPEERNKMGQFATPTALAQEILAHGVRLLPQGDTIRFLDPALGTGSFYSALQAVVSPERIESADGFEIDRHYGEPAQQIWRDSAIKIHLEDFTKAEPIANKANLLICNPPYVRHHHISSETKAGLQAQTQQACGVNINGLSGLYCYFMGLSHRHMAEGGVAGWLIPSEFMGVNYGRMLKRYLLDKVTLLQIHRYDPENVQFDDALVSSAVVWIKNTPPPKEHNVMFTYGGTLAKPALFREVSTAELETESKWTRYPQANAASEKATVTLGDLFDVKRGLATGDNSFFILDRDEIEAQGLPIECFTPVLPSSRYIKTDEIRAYKNGLPKLEKQLFLLDTRMQEDEIASKYPALKRYLEKGNKGEKPVTERYLCRTRKPWYAQEQRPAAPILCTYMGRIREGSKPFRFILNHSKATACNVFLMLYPKPHVVAASKQNHDIMRKVWEFLNEIDASDLLDHGRVYGGGLHKLEPKELRGFPADQLLAEMPEIYPLQAS